MQTGWWISHGFSNWRWKSALQRCVILSLDHHANLSESVRRSGAICICPRTQICAPHLVYTLSLLNSDVMRDWCGSLKLRKDRIGPSCLSLRQWCWCPLGLPMTMLMTLSCPCRSVSSVHYFNGNLEISARTKCAITFSFVSAFPRSRVSRRIFWYNSASCSQGTGWSRWMGGQESLINCGGVRGRRVVE